MYFIGGGWLPVFFSLQAVRREGGQAEKGGVRTEKRGVWQAKKGGLAGGKGGSKKGVR